MHHMQHMQITFNLFIHIYRIIFFGCIVQRIMIRAKEIEKQISDIKKQVELNQSELEHITCYLKNIISELDRKNSDDGKLLEFLSRKVNIELAKQALKDKDLFIDEI